jgi:DNA-binding XRE family transcriptional regulator
MRPNETIQLMKQLFPGLSQDAIGTRIGRSRQTVNTWMKSGMPADQLRPCIAIALLDLEERRAEILKVMSDYDFDADAPEPVTKTPPKHRLRSEKPKPKLTVVPPSSDDDEIIIE